MADVTPGQTLGRGDLNIFLTDSLGNPSNAAEITYALYFYDTTVLVPVEVLIGDPLRVPINPQIGEYYAAIQIPSTAVSGEYHIKWTFRQYVSSPQQQVVQIFQVVGQGSSLTVVSYSQFEWQLINKLRMHLRDQCVGGEEEIEIDVAGEKMVVRLDELWETLKDLPIPDGVSPPLNKRKDDKIRSAFREGTLKIQSVSPEGAVAWKRILNVIRNEVPWEHIVAVTTPYGTKVLTGGHKIYTSPINREKVEDLKVGDHVVAVVNDRILYVPILDKKDLPSRQFMYDLTADTWANFVSTRILLKNSPDKFYHFRPPEHEGEIGQYNRVFGQVWEDAELYEYLVTALDWFNMFPPFTGNMVTSLNQLVTDRPAWRAAIIWYGIVEACFALMSNWVVDEFSVTGETLVRVYLPEGLPVDLPIKDLWEICKGT